MSIRLVIITKRGASEISEKIDDIDVKIMRALLKDSRKKFIDIANECGVSTTTIKNRYNELKKAGIILGSTIIVNVKHLGYMGHLSLYVNVKFNNVEQFLEDVNKIQGVMTYHVKLNENYNVHVLLAVKNIEEIESIKEEIMQHPAVIDCKANIWTEVKTIPENLLNNPL